MAEFAEIEMNRGLVAVVDLEDFDLVNQYCWTASKAQNKNCRQGRCVWYAVSHVGRHWTESIERMHVFLLGRRPGFVIDHINGNGLDNRRENLRWATVSQNISNQRKRTGGSSRFRGVCFDRFKSKWTAGFSNNGKRVNLGRFASEEEAAIAYDDAVLAVRGEFAILNFAKAGLVKLPEGK